MQLLEFAMNIARFAASVLFIVLSFPSFATVNLTPPPSPQHDRPEFHVYVYRGIPIAAISDDDFAKRVEKGAPEQARQCGQYLIAFEEFVGSQVYTMTAFLSRETDGALRFKRVGLIYFFVGVPAPSLVYGRIEQGGVTTELHLDLLMPYEMKANIADCVEGGAAFK